MSRFQKMLHGKQKGACAVQAGQVASRVKEFRLAADAGKPATAPDRLEARLIAWEMPRIATMVEEEMRESARLQHGMLHDGPGDLEIETRVRKISFAKCLSGLLAEMGKAAAESNNDKVIADVTALREDVLLLLNDSYRFKSERMIAEEYLDLQADLVACGEITGVEVPGIGRGVRQNIERMFKMHYDATADQIGVYMAELMDAELLAQ